MQNRGHALVILIALVMLPGFARAVDGVIELNDARAVAGGVTAGDTSGYPITISQPGSYRLTGDLFVSGTNINVVEITADDVTLDLNGFTIKCLFFGPPCAGNGSGIGVAADRRSNVTVRNGTVRDVAAAAVEVGPAGVVEQIRAIANGSGIAVTQGSVRDCIVDGNLGVGITASETVVRDNISRNNATGVSCGSAVSAACVLVGNVITRNTGAPIAGSMSSLGHNRSCDANNLNCSTF